MKKLIEQIIKFGIVGILATIIDYAGLLIFVEVFHIHYLVSSALSFIVSLIFNYLVSMKYVFKSKDNLSRHKEFLIFVTLSIVGLLLNQLIMWITVDKLRIYYMMSKVIATAIVMIWNFVTRKIFLEQKS